MRRATVAAAIFSARGRTSAYDSSVNGAACPGRWQGAQCVNRMGAMSRLNVGAGFSAACGGGADRAELHPATASAPAAKAAATWARAKGMREAFAIRVD